MISGFLLIACGCCGRVRAEGNRDDIPDDVSKSRDGDQLRTYITTHQTFTRDWDIPLTLEIEFICAPTSWRRI